MELNIEPRYDARGFYCVFYHNDQEYIADLTMMIANPFLGQMQPYSECAIFKSIDKQITFENAIPLYCKHDIEIAKETL